MCYINSLCATFDLLVYKLTVQKCLCVLMFYCRKLLIERSTHSQLTRVALASQAVAC